MGYFFIEVFNGEKKIMLMEMQTASFIKTDGGLYSGWTWITKSLTAEIYFTGYLEEAEMFGYSKGKFSSFGKLINFRLDLKPGDEFQYEMISGIFTCKITSAAEDNGTTPQKPVLIRAAPPPSQTQEVQNYQQQIEIQRQRQIDQMNQDVMNLIN